MRVTPWNVAKFWKRLMFPPLHGTYHSDRLNLRGDIPWEPWLHCAVWISALMIVIFGEPGDVPPIDGMDWIWESAALMSPPMGFASVWMLAYNTGKVRYLALWLRMVADFGLACAIFFYQWDRLMSHGDEPIGLGHGVIPNIVLDFAMWFILVLVWRDIKFIIATEKLAAVIYCQIRGLAIKERVGDAH